ADAPGGPAQHRAASGPALQGGDAPNRSSSRERRASVAKSSLRNLPMGPTCFRGLNPPRALPHFATLEQPPGLIRPGLRGAPAIDHRAGPGILERQPGEQAPADLKRVRTGGPAGLAAAG